MIILFRSCEANLSPGSLGEGAANKPRWNGHFKQEILYKCYKSIQSGLTVDDYLIIINDRTTTETLEWMKENTIAKFSVIDITPLNVLREQHKYPSYHPVVINSCQDLMENLVNICKTNPDSLIYVCEDDYLHLPRAIPTMKAMFANGFDGFYVPYDYPERYAKNADISTKLLGTNFGHFRTVPSATLTMAATGSTWLKYMFELLRAGVFADDSWTWKAFAQTTAISPIPGHATHLQDNCITPFVDWENVLNSIEI